MNVVTLGTLRLLGPKEKPVRVYWTFFKVTQLRKFRDENEHRDYENLKTYCLHTIFAAQVLMVTCGGNVGKRIESGPERLSLQLYPEAQLSPL